MSTMKTIYSVLLWLAVVSFMLASCDPLSSVEYKIYNKTADTVTVDMYKEILASSYKGYDIEENDSVTTHYGVEDSISVALLAPEMVLTVHNEWSGRYWEERVIPLWRYIKSITVGETQLPASAWDNESVWHLKTEGGKRFQGESRYYDIVLR